MNKDHSVEDDYTPVKIYFRGENHTAAAEWFMRRFGEEGFDRVMAEMLAKDGHAVTDADVDFEGRGVTIVVAPADG